MKRFEKWRGPEDGSVPTHSIKGTPMSKNGEDFKQFLMDVDRFEPGAEAYVYTVGLRRKMDETRWYYVGQTMDGESGLKKRFKKHVWGKMTKTVQREGINVLDSPLDEETKTAFLTIGIDRIEPVSVEKSSLLEARTLERERQMAYEIALENNTTRVLGGA